MKQDKKAKIQPEEIKKIFSSIALNYDRANKAITFGMDSQWRKKLVKWSKAPKNSKVLDLATGTGALAFEFQKQLGPSAQITGLDFCEEMLKIAKKKANPQKNNIQFLTEDIQKLSFSDNTYDVCSMAYGLRNVADPVKTLKEMARVTKKGGTVMILETGDRPMFFLRPFFYLHFRFLVPHIGGFLTGQKSAYEYLQKSSLKFLSRHKMLKFMNDTKLFSNCECKILFFGASFIYKALVA